MSRKADGSFADISMETTAFKPHEFWTSKASASRSLGLLNHFGLITHVRHHEKGYTSAFCAAQTAMRV